MGRITRLFDSSTVKAELRSLLPQTVLNWREKTYFGRYGEVEVHLVEFLCRQDQDAIDIGANHGGYIHFMRKYAKRVIAFEPVPEFAQLLRRKFTRDVIIETIALSDTVSETRLYTPVIDGVTAGGCGTLSTTAASAFDTHDVIDVRTDRLDNVYGADVGFIKIDVEGHEQAVLDGAIQTISRCHPRVLVEIEEFMSPGGVSRAKMFFGRLGYSGYYVHAGRLKSIEQFSVAEMQDPSGALVGPSLTGTLHDQPPSKDYIFNFIFLPPNEPEATLDRIGECLRQPKVATHHAFRSS